MRQLALTGVALLLALVWLITPALAAGPTASSRAVPAGQVQNLVMMLVYAAVALCFSFICSVAEAVLLSITPSYVANLAHSRPRAAQRLSRLKEVIDRPLAAILTLNTIAHTVGAGGAGAEAAAYFGGKYVGLSMAVLTLLILFLSEIIPKTLGALYWRALAPVTGLFAQGLIGLLYPLILVSEFVTKWLSRGESVHAFSRDEFAAMADIGARHGLLDDKESRILSNLFRLPGLVAQDIMTPRTVVFSLQQDLTIGEVVDGDQDLTFSRIPIYAGDQDEVTGFVLKTDLLLHQADKQLRLRDLKREIRAVHERTRLSQVLEDLLDFRAHITLVVDDFGSMRGIVTLEDAVETLIGIEIVDEMDQIDDMRRLARQKWEERMKRIGIDVRPPDEADPASGSTTEPMQD